jgi:hypothetical protein
MEVLLSDDGEEVTTGIREAEAISEDGREVKVNGQWVPVVFRHLCRIPAYTSALEWAKRMWAAGLAYHLDDAPENIQRVETGERTFNDLECAELNKIVGRLDEDEREIVFGYFIEQTQLEPDPADA